MYRERQLSFTKTLLCLWTGALAVSVDSADDDDDDNNNKIIIIIINDNVYGAVIVTMVTARVHPVHLMNAD